jgi:hypothetical protein
MSQPRRPADRVRPSGALRDRRQPPTRPYEHKPATLTTAVDHLAEDEHRPSLPAISEHPPRPATSAELAGGVRRARCRSSDTWTPIAGRSTSASTAMCRLSPTPMRAESGARPPRFWSIWSPGRLSSAPSASLRDSLRSRLTSEPETKDRRAIGEASMEWSAGHRTSKSEEVRIAELIITVTAVTV